MSTKTIALAPALCSAGGIIAGTLVATTTMDAAMPVPMAGPLLFALSMLGSDILTARAQGIRRRPSGTALFLAGACLVSLWMTAVANADMVPMMLPILGGGMTSPLLTINKNPTPKATEDKP